MSSLFFALLSAALMSVFSLLGVFSLRIPQKKLQSIIIFLLSLAAGTMMADAFFHLLPESLETLEATTALRITFLAFIAFFLIEKVFQWHHCHEENCHVHSLGYMNLIGDSVHNFIDGLIIAASFAVDWRIGLGTSLAIALHELPQEFGDFGVLLHAGIEKGKAILLNFFVSLFAILGVFVGNFLLASEEMLGILLAVAAGGFLYIAAADLLPEIRNEQKRSRLLGALAAFALGILIMYLFTYLE
jgi:zinc and cadmium transporter